MERLSAKSRTGLCVPFQLSSCLLYAVLNQNTPQMGGLPIATVLVVASVRERRSSLRVRAAHDAVADALD